MIFGYARCSTNENKQDIERQAVYLTSCGADFVYKEYGSGKSDERPVFLELQDIVKSGDTIVTTELSRLTRNVHHLCHLLDWASANRISLKFGSFTADFTESTELDPMVCGMILMMGVFAQIEQGITSQRVKSGVAHAKAKGKRLGRPKTKPKDLPKVFKKNYQRFIDGFLTKSDFARLCKCSRPTLDELSHRLRSYLYGDTRLEAGAS